MNRTGYRVSVLNIGVAVVLLAAGTAEGSGPHPSLKDVATDWTQVTSGTTDYLQAVFGVSSDDIYAVGQVGTILHFNGENWTDETNGNQQPLNDVWCGAANDCFAVGTGGAILRFGGVSWAAEVSGTTENLHSIFGYASGDVFVVGDAGTILRFDGATWSEMTSGTGVSLRGVWGSAPDDVFAVGLENTILHYDGFDWVPVDTGVTGWTFYDVWGSGPNEVYAAGDVKALYIPYAGVRFFDGDEWSATSSVGWGASEAYGIWGESSNRIFVVGDSGNISRFDGSSWSPMTSGTSEWLMDVWTYEGHAWVVGSAGTILYRLDPEVFTDGFESGDVIAWSSASP